jgi:hypothetical protein
MTLIDLHKQFWREYRKKPFTPNETLLFHFLLDVWNSTGRKEVFELRSSQVESILEMNKMTLTRCRESLKKRGLIKFTNGSTKGKYPHYSLLHVTDDVTDNVTEYVTENVTDDVTENVTDNVTTHRVLRVKEKERISKDIPKKETDLNFCLPSFVPIMEEWLAYKKKRKESYKTEASVRKCYQNLVKLSDNNPAIAQLIVDQSIANNWAGLFQLKQNGEFIQKNIGRVSTKPSFDNYNESEAKHVGGINSIEL